MPKIGPYDTCATRWGYTPIPDAKTPDAEKATLDTWAREQDDKPYLRFMTAGLSELDAFPFDPGQQREAVGDQNPVAATALGLKNLQRVTDMLVPATTKPGESYDDLREVYGRVVAQWRLEMGHVANVVGGVDSRELYQGQPGTRFTAIPRATQADAVQVPARERFPDAVVPDEGRHPQPDRARRHRGPNPHGADIAPERACSSRRGWTG